MKVLVEIDEKEYGLLCKVAEVPELMTALSELYGKIWTEACYDPDNESTEKYARRLLPLIEKANEILKFKT